MRPSHYPLEQELGMRWYASDADGIGGMLRSSAEDFVVNEIPLPAHGGSGPYLICLLKKKNWEHQHAIKEIAKRLGISHRRIGWAGTKDRRAVTSQLISIYKVSREAAENVRLRDLTLEVIREQNEPLALGDLQGNRFDIIIRGSEGHGTEGRVNEIVRDVAGGVPNYYGIQRFGGIRPVTHVVGGYILKGDYGNAVLTYIGLAFPQEPEHVRLVREFFLKSRDPLAALRNLPAAMGYERAMLQHLHNHPGDYAGALHELPPRLLSMFVSAFQSYLFNEALSMRFSMGLPLGEPVPGDRLVFANGRQDTVHARNAAAAAQHVRRGRCSIAIFLPGRDPFVPVSDGERHMVRLMDEHGIRAGDFARASEFVRTKFEGALRPVALRTTVSAGLEGDSVRLQFTLPPGHYATTVAREFMKADPLRMI
jgi:tRNA pseudouridine13 synthase